MQKVGRIYIGFHGCDASLAEDVLAGKTDLRKSKNKFDWLGTGIYFWVDDPIRPLHFAQKRKKITNPAVIGAVISVNSILNLTLKSALESLKVTYDNFKLIYDNLHGPSESLESEKSTYPFKRYKDCFIIDATVRALPKNKRIDAVLGAYEEGNPLFSGAAQHELNHIQLAVSNPKCILGYFRLRKNDYYNLPPK